MKVRAILEAKNEANLILLSADKFLVQNREILSEPEFDSIVSLKNELKIATDGADKDLINSAIQNLNEFTAPLAHRAMDINIRKAMTGQKI